MPEWPKCQEENKRSAVNSGAIYFSDVAPNDWTTPQNASLWRDAAKTLFDPCPVDWRVPSGGEGLQSPWSGFTPENGPWVGATDNTDAAAGRWFQSGAVWCGATGGRSEMAGSLAWGCEWCHMWSSYLTPEQYWVLRFNSRQIDDGGGNGHRAIGFSVRCIRE